MAKMNVPGGRLIGILPEQKKDKKPGQGKKPAPDKKPEQAQ